MLDTLTSSQSPSRARGQLRCGIRCLAQFAEAGNGMKRLISQCGAGAPEGYRLKAARSIPAGSAGPKGYNGSPTGNVLTTDWNAHTNKVLRDLGRTQTYLQRGNWGPGPYVS